MSHIDVQVVGHKALVESKQLDAVGELGGAVVATLAEGKLGCRVAVAVGLDPVWTNLVLVVVLAALMIPDDANRPVDQAVGQSILLAQFAVAYCQSCVRPKKKAAEHYLTPDLANPTLVVLWHFLEVLSRLLSTQLLVPFPAATRTLTPRFLAQSGTGLVCVDVVDVSHVREAFPS